MNEERPQPGSRSLLRGGCVLDAQPKVFVGHFLMLVHNCTHTSFSILCPGTIGPTQSTYRWVSRGSTMDVHGAPIPLFSPTTRVAVHSGLYSIDNSRSIGD